MVRSEADGHHHLLRLHDLVQVVPSTGDAQEVAAFAGVRAWHPLAALSLNRRIVPLGTNCVPTHACGYFLIQNNS